MTTRDNAPTASSELEPKARRPRRKLLIGTALCSTFLLFQCSKPERDFDAILPGSGGRKSDGKGSGGEGGDPAEEGSGGVATGGRRNTGGMAGGGFGGEGAMGGAAAGGNDGSGGKGTGGAPPNCDGNNDPDCRCVDGVLVARDVDGDGEGTRLCEAAPGLDCDDGDEDFIRNECGGCIKDLGGALGDACGECGVLKCQGDSALVCRSPDPQPQRCADANTPERCIDGNWAVQADCTGSTPVCLNGACVQCNPGAPINTLPGQAARQYSCDTTSLSPDDLIYRCSDSGYWESSWFASCLAIDSMACDATTGTCVTAGIRHPRDGTFDVVPDLLQGVEEKHWGRPVVDVFDSLLGAKFG